MKSHPVLRACVSVAVVMVILFAVNDLVRPDTLVIAAGRPAAEQATSAGNASPKAEKSQDNGKRQSPPAAPGRDGNSKPEPQNGQGRKDDSTGQPAGNGAPPASPVKATPAGTPPAAVSIQAITIEDPCKVSGRVSLSAPYSGTLVLKLTYHVTGTSTFEPTGRLWTGTLSRQVGTGFSIPLGLPTDLSLARGQRVSSFRVEVASASPAIANPTVKSESFECGDVTPAQPTEIPSPSPSEAPQAPLPTEAPTATELPTTTPLPAASATPATAVVLTPDATPEPTKATEGAGTPTPEPLPSSVASWMPTVPVPPSPTPLPSPSLTTVPTATPTLGPLTRIVPDNASSANPGTAVVYHHVVINLAGGPDVKAIHASSSAGWPVSILGPDGVTPLADSDGDGAPDTGLLGRGQFVGIFVKVAVPAGTPRGTMDVTTVTAVSAASSGPEGTDRATDLTTVNGLITMSVSTGDVDFGNVSPLGSIEHDLPGLSSGVDETGASYVRSPAVRITVDSNSPWTGEVRAEENTGTATDISIAGGDLRWRIGGGQTWHDMTTSATTFVQGSPGHSSSSYDYELRVQWEDDPGSFRSMVVYEVSQ